jgi:hypothetical protein
LQVDNTLITGEIAKEVLSLLETTLVDAYGKHITERVEWGTKDTEAKSELELCLQRASYTVSETRKSLVMGLILESLPADIEVDEMLRESVNRVRQKKSPLELEQTMRLQSECNLRICVLRL